MGQLADRIAALTIQDVGRQSTLDELAAIAARAAIIELDNESLAAINARVEQENDLLEAVAEAARRRRDCSGWQDDEEAERASRDALEALDAWRVSQEVPHG